MVSQCVRALQCTGAWVVLLLTLKKKEKKGRNSFLIQHTFPKMLIIKLTKNSTLYKQYNITPQNQSSKKKINYRYAKITPSSSCFFSYIYKVTRVICHVGPHIVGATISAAGSLSAFSWNQELIQKSGKKKQFWFDLVNSYTLLINLVWPLIINWAKWKLFRPPLPSFAHFSQQPQPWPRTLFWFSCGVEELKKGRWALIVLYHKHFTGKETEISTNGVFPKAHPHCPVQQLHVFSFLPGVSRKGKGSLLLPSSLPHLWQ